MKRDNAEALSLEDHPDLTVRELAEMSGLSEQELHALADIGVITAVNAAAPQQRFRAECIVTTRTACRLRNDFELDQHGLALALALLDRVNDLEAQLNLLQARTPVWQHWR